MAGPGGRPVGRVSIRVVPDTSTFAVALEAYLQRVERRLEVNIPVSLNAASVAATEAKLAALTRDRSVAIDVQSRGLDKIGKTLGSTGGRGGGIFGIITNPAIIGAAVAAIGAAVLALPGLISAVAAPLAAIMVGFDGIKRAAQGLAVPFAAMQSTVSNVFEKAFLPGMRELVKIFPTLTEGLNTMGTALGKMFSSMVAALTSPQGLSMISQIFDNIGRALTTLAPAMGPFVDTFLRLAVEGTAAFARFAPLIAQIITGFNDFIGMLERMGLLKPIMDGIGVSILVLLGAFAAIVAISAFIVGGIGLIISNFVRLGTQIGATVAAIVGFVTSLPGRILGALGGLASAIGGAFSRAFAAARSAVSTGVAAVVAFMRGLPGKAKAALSSLPGLLRAAGVAAMRGLWNGLKSLAGSILSWASNFAGKIASAFTSALSIFSPSRVMMKIGENIMEGLRIGVVDTAPAAEAAVLAAAEGIAGIRPTINASVADDVTAPSGNEADRIGRAVAKHLIGGTFRMDSRGDLQLIAAGG